MQICWYLHCLKRLLQIEGGSFWNIKQWLYRHWAKGVCQWGAKEQCSSRHWAIWRELKALSNSIKVFPAAKTKTTMIHAAILFSIHHDSELPSGKFRLQCRQIPLNLMKGKLSFELVSKSIYHCSQIMLERKQILKKIKSSVYSQTPLQNATGMWQENSAPRRSPVRSFLPQTARRARFARSCRKLAAELTQNPTDS